MRTVLPIVKGAFAPVPIDNVPIEIVPIEMRDSAKIVVCSAEMDGKNKLYFGDNLQILRSKCLQKKREFTISQCGVGRAPHDSTALNRTNLHSFINIHN